MPWKFRPTQGDVKVTDVDHAQQYGRRRRTHCHCRPAGDVRSLSTSTRTLPYCCFVAISLARLRLLTFPCVPSWSSRLLVDAGGSRGDRAGLFHGQESDEEAHHGRGDVQRFPVEGRQAPIDADPAVLLSWMWKWDMRSASRRSVVACKIEEERKGGTRATTVRLAGCTHL